MRNKVLLPILLLAAFTLGACNLNNSGNSNGDGTSQVASEYGVAIANKAALQAEWYAGTNRDLDVTLTPAANALAELGKNLTVESSDPETVKVTGLGLSALKAGTVTVTVKYHDASDTVELTILANSAIAKYGVAHEGTAADPFTNEDALAVAKSEKYEGEVYYVKGKIASFYNAPGSRTDGMVAYFLEPAQEGGEKFEVYKCFKEDGSALTDDDIWVNGTAVAYGAFTKYNNQYETSSAVFVSCEGNKPQARQVLEKTFAEVLAAGAALADGADTYDYYKFQGYVTFKSGDNYFLTATKGEELVEATSDADHGSKKYYSNGIELYGATAEGLAAKLLDGAKVEVKMVVKNYHGTVENGLTLAADDVTVIEAGKEWSIETTKVTVAEALAAVNALGDNETSKGLYEVEGYIVAVTTAWSTQYKNISYTLGATADATENLLTVFRAKAAEGTDGTALKAGDKVKVVGNLQKFVQNETTTPELINGTTTLVEAGADQPVDVTDLDAAATVKTVAEIRAMTAANATILAKVTGVAENKYGDAKYGNFHLVDPATGDEITIYGGYSDATFTKTGNTFATKTKTTAVTADIVGHSVTVYGTVGAYNSIGQLVDAKVVVGDAYTGNVAATVAANDETMGTATLSAASVAYGAEITVTPAPAAGFQVAKVEVKRASKTETIKAAEGVYKFKAEVKNEVIVTFEAVPSVELKKVAAYDFSTGNTSTSEYKNEEAGYTALLGRFTSSVQTGEGLSNIVTAATAISKVYAGQNSYVSLGMKFGTSSANGTFTITLSKNVSKVVLHAAGWTATDTVKVNDADAQTPGVAYSEANSVQTLSFNITAANSITITFAKRGYLQAIEFYAED